jgi:hypothetical protein
VLSGERTSPYEASPWKLCCPEEKEPAPTQWRPSAASAPHGTFSCCERGAAQPPDVPGGSWSRRSQQVRIPRLLPRGPVQSVSVLLSSSPSLSLLSFSFWAVDNPHTRKSCLLGPAHCSSPPPPPPSPLPPPSSLLGLRASWPSARPATAAAVQLLLVLLLLRGWGPKQAALTPHLLGPSLLSCKGRGRRRRRKKREEPAGGQGFPNL